MEHTKEKPISFGLEFMSIKPIRVEGATSVTNMQLAYKSVEVYKSWKYRDLITEDGTSVIMEITGMRKYWFKKSSVWKIFIHETPNEFVVKLKLLA